MFGYYDICNFLLFKFGFERLSKKKKKSTDLIELTICNEVIGNFWLDKRRVDLRTILFGEICIG